MTTPSNTPKTPVVVPLPDLKRLTKAISQPTRWKMLKELTLGEARTIRELAGVGGCSYENARKHLAVLQQAGLVEQGRGRLYQIPKQYLPQPGQPVVDFGHCLLRLDAV